MIDLSPVLPLLEKYSPHLIMALGGPLEIVLVGALCLAFNVPPDRLVHTMLDEDGRNEAANRIKNIVIPH